MTTRYFFTFCIFLIVGCASAPKKMALTIKQRGLPGIWRGVFLGKENFVTISCNGKISFDVHTALLGVGSKDKGQITKIANNILHYKSWTGINVSHKLTGPSIVRGCTSISLDQFQGLQLIDRYKCEDTQIFNNLVAGINKVIHKPKDLDDVCLI